MAVRIDIHDSGIDAMLASPPIRKAVRDIAERVQDEAVRISTAEAVDTGRYAASWRITDVSSGRRITLRVHNTARDPESGYNYPLHAIEFSWRHRSGRHMPGRYILLRSVSAAVRP